LKIEQEYSVFLEIRMICGAITKYIRVSFFGGAKWKEKYVL